MKFDFIYQAIGRTPLIKLHRLPEADMADIYVKVESFNPSGSVKDRAALFMIEEAEKKGQIKPGDTLVEPTSGNTGVALAMIGAAKGYKVILVMPDTMSAERRNLMKAYGAALVLTDGKRGMQGAVDEANRLVQEKDCFMPGQFRNDANRQAHYETTALELLEDLPRFDAFVAGVGTGGTISGVGKRLKETGQKVRVVAVQPAKSPLLTGGAASGHGIQGIGANFIPQIYDASVVDEVISVEEEQAMQTARQLAVQEGILGGISSGANLFAALSVAKQLGAGKKVVTIVCDTGERYLSTALFQEP